MRHLFLILLFAASLHVTAQDKISLEQCYTLVNENYPIVKQSILLAQKNELDKKVIKTAKLPTFNLNAQATYQSDVTSVPSENLPFSIPSPNKGQYKANATISQLIYAGGIIDASVKVKEDELITQQKQLEVSLYQLKKQVNSLYFSILLIQEKKELLAIYKTKIEAKIKEIKTVIKYQLIKATAATSLEVEILKLKQQNIELNQNKNSLIRSLSLLAGSNFENKSFETPEIVAPLTSDIKRPELELFQLQKKQLDDTEHLLSKKNAPSLMSFVTTGFGNPGLNMLDNSLQPYYLVGVKFNWNVFDWNANKKQRMSLLVNKDIIDNQKEVFMLNTNIQLEQQQTEIEKINALIKSDKMIIELRIKIVNSTDFELKNGATTTSVYVTEVGNLLEAENKLKEHKIQLLIARANYATTKGN